MSDYEFEMPWPPSVNVWKTPFRNRMILTEKGREYRAKVIEACENLGINNEMIDGEVAVSMVLNPPTLRKYDIDNFTKSLFDGLTHAGFWVDDERVTSLIIRKGVKTKGGNVMMKICCDNNKKE